MPKSYWKTSGQFLKGIGKPLGNAQRLLENLCAILKGYRKAAGKCQNTHFQPIGEEVSSDFWKKRGNFHPFSLKDSVSVYIIKSQRAVENF
jgi:hypothetical protein